jgi:glycosyltransferase involved in cell wall biosynthesis
MRILHVIANLAPRYGGPSKACLEMARAVAARGHEVSIYTTNQDGPGELAVPLGQPVRQGGVELRYFPIQSPRFWGTSLPLARALKAGIRTFDLVHLHSLYLFHNLVAGHYCRQCGVPYLIRPHGTLDPYIRGRHRGRKWLLENLFENRNLKKAAAIHFTTEEERELAAPFTFRTPGVVAPLGIDLGELEPWPEPGAFKAEHPEIGDRKIILFLGRINFKKGLDLLARAFGALNRARGDVHLVIAGPDNDGWGDRIRGWLAAEGVSHRATFTGMLLGREKLAAFRDADLFVLPSYSENFGIAVIEAMACGLPVVISDKVNLWREVAAAGAGKVTPPDASLVAQAMGELLADPDLAARMGRQGRNLVHTKFQWHNIAGKLEEIYTNAVYRVKRSA